jgi:hypothetical protein
MSTVFQAFFVSYLVEPKYGKKKIEILDKQLHTDITYSHDPAIDFILQRTPLSEFMNFCANVTNV